MCGDGDGYNGDCGDGEDYVPYDSASGESFSDELISFPVIAELINEY